METCGIDFNEFQLLKAIDNTQELHIVKNSTIMSNDKKALSRLVSLKYLALENYNLKTVFKMTKLGSSALVNIRVSEQIVMFLSKQDRNFTILAPKMALVLNIDTFDCYKELKKLYRLGVLECEEMIYYLSPHYCDFVPRKKS